MTLRYVVRHLVHQRDAAIRRRVWQGARFITTKPGAHYFEWWNIDHTLSPAAASLEDPIFTPADILADDWELVAAPTLPGTG